MADSGEVIEKNNISQLAPQQDIKKMHYLSIVRGTWWKKYNTSDVVCMLNYNLGPFYKIWFRQQKKTIFSKKWSAKCSGFKRIPTPNLRILNAKSIIDVYTR